MIGQAFYPGKPQRFTRPRPRTYLLDGDRVPGVTTVIGTLDKPALVGWASNVTASHAVENWDRLAGMSLMNRLEELKKARFNLNKKAIVSGKRIHEMAERLTKGEEVEVPHEYRNAVEAFARTLDEWELEAIALETPCAHSEYRYAGTFDGLYYSPRLGTVLGDNKTGKKIYPETALQLAAYRFTDLRLEEEAQPDGPRGGKKPSIWVEKPMIQVDCAIGIHISQDTDESPASVEILPIEAGEREFDTFLHLLEVHETWIKRTGFNFRNDATYDNPIGEPIYPEGNNR